MAGVSFRKSISRSARETCTRIVVPLLAITVLHQPIQPAEISSLLLPPSLSSLYSSVAFSGVSPSLLSRRASLALSWRNSIPQAVQNGEGAHTLLAPAAQDEISFPPAPILCPVIVHVKQPETCICPVGSQRRFPIVLSSVLRPPHHGAILSGVTRYNRADGEDRQRPRGKIPPRLTPLESSKIGLPRVTTARSVLK